jgi:Heterokaryon incompatibility protein (HET)
MEGQEQQSELSSVDWQNRVSYKKPQDAHELHPTLTHDGTAPPLADGLYSQCRKASAQLQSTGPGTRIHGLCSQCRKAGAKLQSTGHGTRIHVLKNGPVAGCHGCRFFDALKWVPRRSNITDTYDLVPGPYLYKRSSQFAVIPSHFPQSIVHKEQEKYRTKERAFFVHGHAQAQVGELGYGVVVKPIGLDYDRIGEWLKFCDCHHTTLCQNTTPVGSLAVIDCTIRQMTTLNPLDPYLTLSYVWGTASFEWANDSGKLPDKLERTIEDAMVVVIGLGFRYLWVDRYCIPQNNAAEKKSQIQRMGDIYAQSTLTIIAAAGEDPEYGLPGVSLTPRMTRPSVQISNLDLVSLPPLINLEISRSSWSLRGWTYQEGLLARRRLLFTDSQVYFQCAGMHCQESFSIPLHNLHVKDLTRFRNELTGFFPRFGVGKTSDDLLSRIPEYAHRKFSYASDALDAFQGVLRAFQSFPNPVHHICGVVILSPSTFKSTKTLTSQEMLIFGLCWNIQGSNIRRPEFPSWTWLGWSPIDSCEYVVKTHSHLSYHNFTIPATAVTVETREGVTLDVEDSEWWSPGCVDYPLVLVIQAWTLELSATSIHRVTAFDLWTSDTIRTFNTMNKLCKFVQREFEKLGMLKTTVSDVIPDILAMVMVQVGEEEPWSTNALLVRYNQDKNAYERVPFPLVIDDVLVFDESSEVAIWKNHEFRRREIRLI